MSFNHDPKKREKVLNFFSTGMGIEGENIQNLASVFADEVQVSEDVLYSLVENVFIDRAFGAFLDRIGNSLGIERFSSFDDEYRSEIRSYLLITKSRGTCDELIEIAKRIFKTDKIRIQSVFPFGIILNISEPETENSERSKELFSRALASGVKLLSVISSPEFPFGFEDDPSSYGFDEGFFSEEV
jgi:hypothetical protein